MRQRLEDQHGIEPAETRAADIVAHIDAAETERAGLADHIGREMPVTVPVERVRRDTIPGESFRHRLYRALVLRSARTGRRTASALASITSSRDVFGYA